MKLKENDSENEEISKKTKTSTARKGRKKKGKKKPKRNVVSPESVPLNLHGENAGDMETATTPNKGENDGFIPEEAVDTPIRILSADVVKSPEQTLPEIVASDIAPPEVTPLSSSSPNTKQFDATVEENSFQVLEQVSLEESTLLPTRVEEIEHPNTFLMSPENSSMPPKTSDDNSSTPVQVISPAPEFPISSEDATAPSARPDQDQITRTMTPIEIITSPRPLEVLSPTTTAPKISLDDFSEPILEMKPVATSPIPKEAGLDLPRAPSSIRKISGNPPPDIESMVNMEDVEGIESIISPRQPPIGVSSNVPSPFPPPPVDSVIPSIDAPPEVVSDGPPPGTLPHTNSPEIIARAGSPPPPTRSPSQLSIPAISESATVSFPEPSLSPQPRPSPLPLSSQSSTAAIIENKNSERNNMEDDNIEIVPIHRKPPRPRKNQVTPFESMELTDRPTSTKSMRTFSNRELFSNERATTNLSATAINQWQKPEWIPDELDQKLNQSIEMAEISGTKLPAVVFSKNEREYIPFDAAKAYFKKMVENSSTEHSNYVITIRKLEDKYKRIELEANGHFSAFVTNIKSQYALKFDTFRKLLSLHKKEIAEKHQEWEGVVKSLKQKNGRLMEQRKCLMLAYKTETHRITTEKDSDIEELREENEKLRRELAEAYKAAKALPGVAAIAQEKENATDEIVKAVQYETRTMEAMDDRDGMAVAVNVADNSTSGRGSAMDIKQAEEDQFKPTEHSNEKSPEEFNNEQRGAGDDTDGKGSAELIHQENEIKSDVVTEVLNENQNNEHVEKSNENILPNELLNENADNGSAMGPAQVIAGAALVGAAKADGTHNVAHEISEDEVLELKRQIEDLKTQIASMEAGTVQEEKVVADKLEASPDLLENLFALQIEVEELRKLEDNTDSLQEEIEVMTAKLEESEKTKTNLETKIGETLEDLKTAESEDIKLHLEELEARNLELGNENAKLNTEIATTVIKLKAAEDQKAKLEKRTQNQHKMQEEARQNPRRAAAAVSAAIIRGNRTGGADPAEIKQLKTEIKSLNKIIAENAKQTTQTERKMEREKTMVQRQGNKTESDLEKYKKRYEITREKLTKKEEECKLHTAELSALQRTSKGSLAEIKVLKAKADELDKVKAELAEAEKSKKKLESEVVELTDKYSKEMLLRKKYYNQIEDMKGKVRVYCRSRPLSKTEKGRGNFSVVQSPDEYTVKINTTNRGVKEFNFDQIYTEANTQDEVFADTSFLLQSAFDGFNVCIFAYGQTGSGKTFTMIGTDDYPGIAPRAFKGLYDIIESNKSKFETNVSLYMMELYCDQLQDLLADKKDAGQKYLIKKDKKGMVYVLNSKIEDVSNVEELQAVFDRGATNRKTSSTKMNAESSRSHLVLSLLLEVTNKTTGAVNRGKFSLIDLAGSERFAKTDASPQQLKEANSINKSLSALGDVIAALCTEASFVPYRNNKLTELMQDSLGGNAKTLMFVNISPADYNQDETVTSLTYAARVKEIKNTASKNADTKEVARLKEIIAKYKAGDAVIEEEI